MILAKCPIGMGHERVLNHNIEAVLDNGEAKFKLKNPIYLLVNKPHPNSSYSISPG
jgi:hypothetical protein